MYSLPDDIQWYIWKMLYSQTVVRDIVSKHKNVWEDPSDRLLKLCKDPGCILHGSHELRDLIEDENMWCWHACMDSKCGNCVTYGFPCDNLAYYGFQIPQLARQWEANF